MSIKTDYAKLASNYDDDREKYNGVMDRYVEGLIKEYPERSWNILDLACGTGLWLRDQRKFFQNKDLTFTGMDASEHMLQQAQQKVPAEILRQGTAEHLPFDDDSFDLVTTHMAFHHFVDKAKAIQEIIRVTKPNGSFRLFCTVPERSPDWWIYNYFPAAIAADKTRFWSLEEIQNCFVQHGWQLNTEVHLSQEVHSYDELIDLAERRVISQLAIIDDSAHRNGLERLYQDRAEMLSKNQNIHIKAGLQLVNMVASVNTPLPINGRCMF